MVTWNIEVTQAKGEDFPWRAAVVSSGGKRQEVGEFLAEKEARNYAAMELHQLTSKEKPAGDLVATEAA